MCWFVGGNDFIPVPDPSGKCGACEVTSSFLLTYLLTYLLKLPWWRLYWCLLCSIFRHNLPDRVSRGEEVRLGVSVLSCFSVDCVSVVVQVRKGAYT